MLNILGIVHLVLRTEKRDAIFTFYTVALGCYLERETIPETGLTQWFADRVLIDFVDIHSQLGRQGCGAPTETENNLDHQCLLIFLINENRIFAHFD
ncbi:hypothetical protein [Grimontia marina]|uniref:Glyoxalase-like domain protein n=1 Tax=Grimontia marina TaxID=646534 RepID=A0A128F1H6_9GAMM|nr:hypothetical protein [Grimontia marina]CZF80652.1 hypothetical protein GMA8713_01539 [Grimontia marina]